MKKLFITAAIVVGIGAIGRRVVAHCMDTGWATRLEALPDSAPPKWLFTNVTAIRENTDHIRATLDAAAADLHRNRPRLTAHTTDAMKERGLRSL